MRRIFFYTGSLVLGCAAAGCWAAQRDVEPTEGRRDTGDSETAVDTGPAVNPGITWIALSPGTFTMGSPTGEWGHDDDERRHPVTLTHSFEIAETEVTVGQWEGLGFPPPYDLQCAEDNCPVTRLVGDQIPRWLDQLSAMNGFDQCYGAGTAYPSPYHCNGYRLPTEAEWEYAARAGTDTATYNGDSSPETGLAVLEPVAWCESATGIELPVAQKLPNAFGLYDMLGNVDEYAEWVGVYPAGEDVNPFVGDRDDRLFVLRGGAVGTSARSCRAAFRDLPRVHFNTIYPKDNGFRPVRTLPNSELPDPAKKPDDNSCPEAASYSCPGRMVRDTRLLVPASLAGESAVFGAMSRVRTDIGVLGKRSSGDGDEIFLLVADVPNTEATDSEPVIEAFTVTSLTGAPTVDRIVALTESAVDDRFIAVLCGGGSCFLAASSASAADPAEFFPLEGGEIPEGMDPADAVIVYDTTVVVGDGVAFYRDGQWETPIMPGTGRRFTAVDGQPTYSNDIKPERAAFVAVGEGGRLAVGSSGAWQERESGVLEDLLDVKLKLDGDLYFIAVGAFGQMLLGTAESQISCAVFDTDLTRVGLITNYGEPEYIIISEGGDVIYYPRETSSTPICHAGRLQEPVLDFEIFTCGIAENRVYLLNNGVYGGLGCPID